MAALRGSLLGLLAAVPVALLGGCALSQPRAPLSDAAVLLAGTPFFAQRDFLCGPAALATVLGAAGADVHPDELIAGLYIPERRGTLQVELVAATRRRGYLAVRIDETEAAIVAQLEAGRPVLVLQNLAFRLRPVWHYAVVVGYRPDEHRWVLRSGGEPELATPRARFAATWSRAQNWGVVVLDPRSPPTALPARNYLQAAADLENIGAHETALTAFRTALGAWPDEPAAQLGVANNLYYLERYPAAVDAYRALLTAHPDDEVAVHNLAMLLLELGRVCEAQRLVKEAGALSGALIDTARREVAAAGGCAGVAT
ncbi:MAG: PA2778 family cysteine peptidase [Pseudomonadales bacterium]